MKAHIIDTLPFIPDIAALGHSLGIKNFSQDMLKLEDLVGEAAVLGRPRCVFRESCIESRGEDFIKTDGVTLRSSLLAENARDVGLVFPYLATCGQELETWADGLKSLRLRFWAETIMISALESVLSEINRHIDKLHRPGPLISMNPGSLESWPISEQRTLFNILGDSSEKIGVRLTESGIMRPLKSISGIYLPSTSLFHNCKLCNRQRCPDRRYPCDTDMTEPPLTRL